jgi:hypothetical protein
MVKIARVVAFNPMAPPAQGSHVADKRDFFVSGGFFIRLCFMAIQTHLGVNRAIGQDLVMGVQRWIFFSVMAAVTEIRFPGIGRSPQGIPVEQAFYTLPVYIMTGVACESPVCQWKSRRRSQFPVQFSVDIQRMAVAARHAVMTPVAEPLVVAVVFQINRASFDRCSFMAHIAIFSGKMDVGILIDDRRLRRRHCRFGNLPLRQWLAAQK